MNRLLVALLAALDAVIAAAVGVAVALVPLALLWMFGMAAPAWSALWPAASAVWQFGHLVPLVIHLPAGYLAVTGIPEAAATFTLSLAPLAFTAFTAIFAARSGSRAARAGEGPIGALTGTVVFAAAAAVICFTSRSPIAAVHAWQAVLFPAIVFAVGALGGAFATAWHDGDGGIVDRLHDRVEALPVGWRDLPGAIARGAAIALAGLIGVGALAVAVGAAVGAARMIALYETANMNAIGVILTSLAQLAYLPTLVVWGLSFAAGPGFALGAGTAVSPAGTQLGVVPGIPVLGIVPGSTSPWLLAVVLLPIAVGAFAGWAIRSRMAGGLHRDHLGVNALAAVGIAVTSGLGAALLAALASGSLGPGRLAEVGPAPWPLALAVGVEVLVGAAILLLAPSGGRHEDDAGDAASPASSSDAASDDDPPTPIAPPVDGPRDQDAIDTAPVDPGWLER